MYQTPLTSNNFNAMNVQYTESFTPGPNRTGLVRSASTSFAIINNGDQPRPPPRRRKRGESLGSDQLGSANSSQYSLVNYPYNEMDPNTRNTNTIKQMPAWTPNSTLRRYMSSDMAPSNYNRHFNAIGNQLMNNYNEQMQKPVGVLDQVINRSMPTPPPRLSSAKNTLRRRSYVENLVSTFEPPAKPLRQKLQSGLNQSQFDIPGTPITTHLPPQSMNRFVSTPNRPSMTLSSINLSQTANFANQPPTPPRSGNRPPSLNNPALSAMQATLNKNTLNRSNANLDYQVQPFYNKTMSLDNLHAATLKQTLRRSPTREELFDYIVAQQEQLSELKTQQKVLEKQVDIAHKEASKAHHHHHHRRHRHHKANRSKERDNILDNSIDSSSMISSERRSKSHHHRTKVDKNLTAEANRQVHDHIKQLQEQLELIRQKRRKIKSDKSIEPELEQIDQALDKSIGPSLLDNLKEKNGIRNSRENENKLLRPPDKQATRSNQTGNVKEDDLHNNRLSPIPTPMSSNRSPLNSRSSSIERAITKRELLRESAKEKWNRSFMEDLADDQLIKELSKSSANQDLLKELLPKISINTDDKHRDLLNYNEILEKNLKLNPPQNWLTDPLDEYTYSERSPIEPLSPFGGRTGVFRPISADGNILSPGEDKSRGGDLLTGGSGYPFSHPQTSRGVDRKETSSPIPRNYFPEDNIEGYISKKVNNLITGDIDLLGKGNRVESMGLRNNEQAMSDQMMMNSMANNLMANNLTVNGAVNSATSDSTTEARNSLLARQEQQQQFNLLKKQEEQLIERLENELMNEKQRQKELMDKKNEIERRQMEHDIELEKTKRHLLEQQNLFQEQQQLLQNQRQEIEIERWRMEQEKNQLKHEHEMKSKRDQFEQQKVLNQQLEQQRRTFDQQLQNQKALQEQLQKELEHQRQLQIKNQQKSANALNAALANSQQQQQQQSSMFAGGRPAQPVNFYNDSQQMLQSGLGNLPQTATAAGQQKMSLNTKKSPLTSPLQSLQSLLPHALQPKSLQNALQQQSLQQQSLQQHSQIQSQQQFPGHDQLQLNEPTKPRRHRLGQDDHSHQFSAFKPPMHSNSKLNLIDSPKSSFNAINQINQITTPFISTEQRAPSPRPPFTSNPGMLSSTSSLTRQQPVGLMSSFTSPGGQQQQQQFNNRSQEHLNRSRQNFFGSGGELDQSHKTNQYFGSGGKLNLSRTEINLIDNTNFAASNYNNKNLSTGSLHLAHQQQQQQQQQLLHPQQQDNRLISGQQKPKTASRKQFRMGLGYQQDQYDKRQYSSHTNLNANQHSHINGPRRNSVMDPFREHFDQYFTPKKQATTSTSNLKPPATAASHKVSSLSNTATSVSPTTRSPVLSPPPLNAGLNPAISSPVPSNTMNSIGNTVANLSPTMTGIDGLAVNDATQNKINNLQANAVNRKEFRNQTKDALLDPLDKLNENKDTLAEYQGLNPNRRLTMPELPRALETATSNEQIKGYAVSKAQPKGDPLAASTSAAMRRKNSLPENVQSAAAVIKPGWGREEVSVLAHEAREAKAKAAELTGTQVTVMKLKDWFIANLFVISLVVFNAACLYVYLQLMRPLD